MPASADGLRALRGSLPGKNVLLVVLESAGARYLAPFGSAEDVMPNLSALSRRGLVFENTYAVYPESVRGIVSYLASRYPGFDIQNGEHARIASPSLATELSRAGYRTALFHSGRFIYLGMDEILAASGFHVLEDAGDIGGNHNSSFGVDEPAAVARILGWMDSLPAGTRFFAAWLPVEGHHPYTFTPPAPFPPGDDFGNYRNALFDADRSLGVLLDGLRRRGLDSNTIVVVTSDHAEAFGQHPGNFGHTLALYEENVRVPLVIALPQGATREMRFAETASLLDIAPTILDLLGLQRPQQFQGSSLLDGREQMALFFTDYSLGLLGARDGCVKFVYEMESRRSRMFDLCQDPDETTDISARQPALAAAYRDRLTRWIAAQVENLRG
jgi:arylsulfatase A-like enzyme